MRTSKGVGWLARSLAEQLPKAQVASPVEAWAVARQLSLQLSRAFTEKPAPRQPMSASGGWIPSFHERRHFIRGLLHARPTEHHRQKRQRYELLLLIYHYANSCHPKARDELQRHVARHYGEYADDWGQIRANI